MQAWWGTARLLHFTVQCEPNLMIDLVADAEWGTCLVFLTGLKCVLILPA